VIFFSIGITVALAPVGTAIEEDSNS
jgi:hypothetical protein